MLEYRHGPNRTGVVASDGRELSRCLSGDSAAARFVERMQVSDDVSEVRDLGDLLRQLASLTLSDQERFLLQKGFQSKRTLLEGSFLRRWAYHCFREFAAGDGTFRPAIDESTGGLPLRLKLLMGAGCSWAA